MVLFLPTDNMGIVLLANQTASNALMIIANLICDKLLKLPYQDWNANQANAYRDSRKELKDQFLPAAAARNPLPSSHPLADYCGTYSHPGYGKITVFSSGDALYGSYGSMKVRFRHESSDTFTAFIYQWEAGIMSKMIKPGNPANIYTIDLIALEDFTSHAPFAYISLCLVKPHGIACCL